MKESLEQSVNLFIELFVKNKMERYYYNREIDGDILHVVFDEQLTPDSSDEKDGIVVLKFKEKVVGINFLNISKTMKIFHEGEIVDPSREFVVILNHMLKNAGVNITLG